MGRDILTLVFVPFQAHGTAAIYFPVKIKHVKSFVLALDGLPMYGLDAPATLEVAVDNGIK